MSVRDDLWRLGNLHFRLLASLQGEGHLLLSVKEDLYRSRTKRLETVAAHWRYNIAVKNLRLASFNPHFFVCLTRGMGTKIFRTKITISISVSESGVLD